MIVLDTHAAVWWTQEPELLGREAAPLSAEIALAADALEMHPDPADRFIVATALRLKAALVTKDRLLQKLRWLRTVW